MKRLVTIICLVAASGMVSAALFDPAVALNRKWAEEMFPSLPAERLIILHEDELGDTRVGRCAAGGPLRLGDRVYPHGIGVNSQSTLRVMLDRPVRNLVAVVGLDRNVDNTKASCRFLVRAGNKEVFATEILRANAAPRAINVPVGGRNSIEPGSDCLAGICSQAVAACLKFFEWF